MLPKNELLGITRDIYFFDEIIIERKGSLEELSNNFTKDRQRFKNEFLGEKGKIVLLIENATYDDIVIHNYRTKYEGKSFIASLKAFETRFDINTQFVPKKMAGNFIYHTFYYWLREFLKNDVLMKVN